MSEVHVKLTMAQHKLEFTIEWRTHHAVSMRSHVFAITLAQLHTGLLVRCIPVDVTAGQLSQGNAVQPFSADHSPDDPRQQRDKFVIGSEHGIPAQPSKASASTTPPLSNTSSDVIANGGQRGGGEPHVCHPCLPTSDFDLHDDFASSTPYIALSTAELDRDGVRLGA
jgi:hypothetical protein